ncbi:MAG: anti-sigma factor [Paraburkholderia sp.]|jgi:anti-sigma-K factor RskA|uniref:anti-sigma factor n=2 Tax=Burkholderiaceae TaxID=119060 RepID=UPI0010F46F89|nr:anti-sigma factor [Burkholderia sp. 4M9327F10]
MNLHRYPQLADLLAAEYALGTLRGGARRRLQRYAEHDVVIRRLLEEWQQRLEPMAELVPARMPSAAVWEAIEQRLGIAAARGQTPERPPVPAQAAPAARPARGWFDNLAFWRGWAIGATALAAIAVVMAVRSLLPSATLAPQGAPTLAQQPEAEVSHVAVLNNKDAQPVMLVAWDEAHSTMTLHRIGDTQLPPERAMQLWGIPASGHPVSLGMLPNSGNGKIQAAQQRPENYAALAISIEPPGGSPNPNGPSGPVVFSGKLVPVS